MKVDPVNIHIDETIEKPPECLRPRPTLSHWREEGDKILDNLEEAGLIEKLDILYGFLSPSFHVLKPHNILTTCKAIDYSHVNSLVIRPGQKIPYTDKVIR